MRQFSAHRRIGLSFRMFELIWFNLGDRFRPIGKHSIGMEAINDGAPYVLRRTHKLRGCSPIDRFDKLWPAANFQQIGISICTHGYLLRFDLNVVNSTGARAAPQCGPFYLYSG
jgi:hypothetical protein